MATTFTGFVDADGTFFKKLAKHNDRDWFAKHKLDFEVGWNEPMRHLLADVRAGIDGFYETVELAEPKVFRIFRDVRFSKDKSPYKTHIGGFVPLARTGVGTTDLPFAIYVHVGADERFAGAGHYVFGPTALAKFRLAVADEKRGAELEKILKSLAKAGFPADEHERFKRVPKGFAEDHPRAELLKRKGLTVRFPEPKREELTSPKLARTLIAGCKKVAPLVEWLTYATV